MSATIDIELSPALAQVMTLVDALTLEDRQKLQLILEKAEVRQAWKSEIQRRMQEIESGNVVGIPAEEVHERIRAKLAKMRVTHEGS